MPMVKGMQEQQAMIEKLQKQNEEQNIQNIELRARLDKLEKK